MGCLKLHSEDRLQFRSKSIIAYRKYHRPDGDFVQSSLFKANASKLKHREKYTGKITAGAKKRLSKALSLLVQTAKREYVFNPVTNKHQEHRLSFITLTLPDVAESKDAKFVHKELLQPFLQTMRRKHGMRTYLWKAELQKNGSVHYHITTTAFIPYYDIRDRWNTLVRKHGMLDKFKKQYGHDNPNSIDIHSVQKVQDMEAYLLKYISKETQNEIALSGKVWDCSLNLKRSEYYTTTNTHDIHNQIRSDIDSGQAWATYLDRCVVIRYHFDDYYISFSQDIINDYYSHLNSIITWEHSSQCGSLNSTTQSETKSSIMQKQGKTSQGNNKSGSKKNYGEQLKMFRTSIFGHHSPEEWNRQPIKPGLRPGVSRSSDSDRSGGAAP